MRDIHMGTKRALLTAAVVLTLAPVKSHAAPLDAGGAVIGARLGAGFGQPLGDLGTSFVGQLELGWVLDLPEPFGRSLQPFFACGYTGPESERKTGEQDPRLPEGAGVAAAVSVKQVLLDTGLLYRLPLDGALRPYASAGLRVALARTELTSSAGGVKFPDREETGTHLGFVSGLGVDWLLGPGAVDAELQFAYVGDTGGRIRDAGLGALSLLVGYRLFL